MHVLRAEKGYPMIGQDLAAALQRRSHDIAEIRHLAPQLDGAGIDAGHVQQIRHEAIDLSVMIASKIIQRNGGNRTRTAQQLRINGPVKFNPHFARAGLYSARRRRALKLSRSISEP